MSNYVKNSLVKIAETWPTGQLDDYIQALEIQIRDIKDVLYDLKALQSKRKKEDNRKRESGTRGGV